MFHSLINFDFCGKILNIKSIVLFKDVNLFPAAAETKATGGDCGFSDELKSN